MGHPIKQQRLRGDTLQFLQHERSLGNEIGGEAILRAVEQFAGKAATGGLRELLLEASIPQRKPGRRGRPCNHSGKDDFALEQIDKIYPWLLKRYQTNKPEDSAERRAPSERAYRFLARRARKVLMNIDWASLRNKHTRWKRGRFHAIENSIDSEDYEAEIDRQFPPASGSQHCSTFP